ncbi:hypothetical protein [Nocardia sp. NPDC049526]
MRTATVRRTIAAPIERVSIGASTRVFAPAVAFGFRTALRTAGRKLTG